MYFPKGMAKRSVMANITRMPDSSVFIGSEFFWFEQYVTHVPEYCYGKDKKWNHSSSKKRMEA
jgi:hypothetical protein